MEKRNLVAKWNAKGSRWHWCVGYSGPTLCGIGRLRSVAECAVGPMNKRYACRRCAAARRSAS
jgi:hypothetical protein